MADEHDRPRRCCRARGILPRIGDIGVRQCAIHLHRFPASGRGAPSAWSAGTSALRGTGAEARELALHTRLSPDRRRYVAVGVGSSRPSDRLEAVDRSRRIRGPRLAQSASRSGDDGRGEVDGAGVLTPGAQPRRVLAVIVFRRLRRGFRRRGSRQRRAQQRRRPTVLQWRDASIAPAESRREIRRVSGTPSCFVIEQPLLRSKPAA